MPLTSTRRPVTTTRRRGLFSRRAPAHHHQQPTVTTTTTTTTRRRGLFGNRTKRSTVQHQHHKPTMKDKVSGALLKLKGSLTHRPAVKAAGTRRMRGTDGRGSRRANHY
ncbi:Fc.00g100530.m01.CDS01 [Cosmosporella sp. VM-42]